MNGTDTHFKDKNVIITGGSSGIGKSTAKLLARNGANIFILARDREKLNQAIEEIRAEGDSQNQSYRALPADVTSWKAVEAAVTDIVEASDAPHILINSAGIVHPGHFQELPLSTFHHQMDVNYFGTLHAVKAVLPYMMAQGEGHIVNISSFGGVFGAFGYSAYGASKFAVCGFTEVLRAELHPHDIAVSLVIPPDTDTPQLEGEEKTRPLETKLMSGTSRPEKLERLSETIAYGLAKWVLSDNGAPMKPDRVAETIVRGIQRRRYLIFPDTMLMVAYYLRGFLLPVANWAQDQLVEVARRQRKAQ